jgi:hypothetical protein
MKRRSNSAFLSDALKIGTVMFQGGREKTRRFGIPHPCRSTEMPQPLFGVLPLRQESPEERRSLNRRHGVNFGLLPI